MDPLLQLAFRSVYETNGFGGTESVSGPGSSLASTERVRGALEELVRELGVRSLLDAPCGDFHWMERVDLGGAIYIGLDIVPDLIAQNRERYRSPTRIFGVADLTSDHLPNADLVLCRDALVHLPDAAIARFLERLRAGASRWLLATSFPGRGPQVDIHAGAWRPIDLCAAPFAWPAPERWIYEGHPEPYQDKALGLWDLAAVRAALRG